MSASSTSSDSSLRSAPKGGRRRRLLIWLLALANLVVFGGVGFVFYWASRASSEIATIPQQELPSIDRVAIRPERPRNFLVIGSDSRESVPEDFPDFFGQVEGERADVIMLVHVVPGEDRLQILSIPRDLKVEIPGEGTQKINAAYEIGGPDLMVQTVKAVTDLPVHHYVEVDFVGFARIVDALGGVTMYFPYPARDARSGLSVPGCVVHMDGAMALAYVRSRHYQELRDGRWVTVQPDDIARIERQQRLIFAVLAEAKRPDTITELGELVRALGDHVQADTALDSRTMLQLAWDLRALGPEDVGAMALPVEFVTEEGIDFVVARQPETRRVLEAFRLGTSLEQARTGPMRLQVLNGNGREGMAADLADQLEGRGFEVVDVGNAEITDYRTTLVVARPQELSQAETVADRLGFGDVLPGEVPEGIDVIVIVGDDAAVQAGVPSGTDPGGEEASSSTTTTTREEGSSCE